MGRAAKSVFAVPFYVIGRVVGWIFAAIRFVIKSVVLGFQDSAG